MVESPAVDSPPEPRTPSLLTRLTQPHFQARQVSQQIHAQTLLALHLIVIMMIAIGTPVGIIATGRLDVLATPEFMPFMIYALGLLPSYFAARRGYLLPASLYMIGGFTVAVMVLLLLPGQTEAGEGLFSAALIISVALAGLLLPRVMQLVLTLILISVTPLLVIANGGTPANDFGYYAIMLGGGVIFYIYDLSRERLEGQRRGEIQAAHDRMNHLLTTSPTVIYAFDKFFNPTYVSETVRRFGFTPGDFAVTPNLWSARLHPEDRDTAIRSMREVLRSGELTHEYRWQAADGVYHVLRDSLRLVRDAQGNPLEIVGTWSDISEVRSTQEALTRSEALYRTLANNFPNGAVALYDKDLRFLVVGGSDPGALGLKESQYTEGLTLSEVFPPETAAMMETLYHAALTGEHLQTEVAYGDHTYDISFSPVRDEAGEIEFGLVLANDVTERKRYARRLETQADELRRATTLAHEANRLKSEFLATMSHELRTPLNAIIGFTEIMLAGMSGQLDADTSHMVTRIHANSQRLLRLINDVLDMARIEAGRIDLQPAPLAPRRLFTTLREEMGTMTGKKEVEFSVEVADSLPDTVIVDESALRKIINNLLSNALKFTDAGRVTLSAAGEADQWVLEVTDTGIGIPPHELGTIFEPFRQVDGSSSRSYGGTGLGLSIVQELVRAMDGQVSVESSLGQGSRFTVRLPLQPKAAQAPQNGHSSPG